MLSPFPPIHLSERIPISILIPSTILIMSSDSSVRIIFYNVIFHFLKENKLMVSSAHLLRMGLGPSIGTDTQSSISLPIHIVSHAVGHYSPLVFV